MNESTTLVEQGADWRSEAQVDRASRLVRNVALAGPASKNGYRYLETALREGAALYERKPVFLDHARDPRRPQERSTRDLVGSVVHPRFEAGRIRGDIAVLDTEAGQTFLSLVESDAPGVGMSHVVLAERGGDDGAVVERIHDVISVDAVIGPATTTTFHESAADDEDSLGTESESRVDEERFAPLPELEALRGERDALAKRVRVLEQRLGAADRQTAVQRMLSSSGLPDFAVTPLFAEQLGAAEEGLREQLISERRELISRLSAARPQSASRHDVADAESTSSFVAAICGRRAGSARRR